MCLCSSLSRALLHCSLLVGSLVLAAVMASPAGAGNWATITLDNAPAEIRAGATHRLGYTILQHGVTPYGGAVSSIRARSSDGVALTFPAQPEGATGHYVATVRFPNAGTWTWEIVPGPFAPQVQSPLIVLPMASSAAGQDAAAAAAVTPGPRQLLPVVVALGTVLAGAGVAYQLVGGRRRPKPMV